MIKEPENRTESFSEHVQQREQSNSEIGVYEQLVPSLKNVFVGGM